MRLVLVDYRFKGARKVGKLQVSRRKIASWYLAVPCDRVGEAPGGSSFRETQSQQLMVAGEQPKGWASRRDGDPNEI